MEQDKVDGRVLVNEIGSVVLAPCALAIALF